MQGQKSDLILSEELPLKVPDELLSPVLICPPPPVPLQKMTRTFSLTKGVNIGYFPENQQGFRGVLETVG